MRRRIVNWLATKIALLVRSVEQDIDQKSLPEFRNTPRNLRIESPHRLVNAKHIEIGDDVSLGPGCMINAIRQYPGRFMSGVPGEIESRHYSPDIKIGNRVSATGYLTIGACSSVIIEDDVLFASSVFISDNSHGRSRTDVPYKYQPLEGIANVVIGQGCWIGEHVVVMPGVTIGAYAIIGANSVVNRDIPPRCIAVGSPIRIVKVWDEQTDSWRSPSPQK
jgi:acetyltransferase-like isoleucine patch superfamily enzyme